MQKILDEKKYFKLICGAGNKDVEQIKELIKIYAKAGANVFDVAADFEIIKEAQKILKKFPEKYLCISIGTKNDKHISKAIINENKCVKCKKCVKTCPQNAIEKNISVIEEKCIGCGKCAKICPKKAISFYSQEQNLNDIITFANENAVECIELHSDGVNKEELYEVWEELNNSYKGILSICIGTSKLKPKELAEVLQKLIAIREPYTTIIQADGVSMSGSDDKKETTMPAIETAKFIQSLKLPAYLTVSGGTNSKTSKLAKKENVELHGVAIGSFARKIIKKNPNKKAKELVEKTLKYMTENK